VPGVRTVTAANEAVGGYTTTDVLKQLTDDKAVIGQFSSADAVEVEIGANDVPYNSRCGTDLACYTPSVPPMEQNLDTIVKRVRELLAGRPAVVVLLDYWSVWLGGKYAQQKGPDYVAAAEAVTHEVDTAIRAVATRTGSFYVDLRSAFKGPSYSYDESHYLAPDGDHPNAEGHKQIAAAVVTVVESGLHLPPS
jgi:lysophospholipase L1-like esterase